MLLAVLSCIIYVICDLNYNFDHHLSNIDIAKKEIKKDILEYLPKGKDYQHIFDHFIKFEFAEFIHGIDDLVSPPTAQPSHKPTLPPHLPLYGYNAPIPVQDIKVRPLTSSLRPLKESSFPWPCRPGLQIERASLYRLNFKKWLDKETLCQHKTLSTTDVNVSYLVYQIIFHFVC